MVRDAVSECGEVIQQDSAGYDERLVGRGGGKI